MKGAIAAALTGLQALDWQESRERPVDRLTALGAMQNARAGEAENAAALRSLGQDVIAAKFANRADVLSDAIDKLAAQLAHIQRLKLRPALRDKIAYWAMREHVQDACPRCRGAKEIPLQEDVDGYQPMIPCPPAPIGCNGTGRKRYSDAERIAATGAAHAEAFERAHEILTRAEHLAVETAAKMLERLVGP